jgi:ABC-type Co2+ transport system permease subunit
MLPERPAEAGPVWLPPVVSLVTLFVLFLAAVVVRRSGLGALGTNIMIGLSTIASAAIALYGVKMIVQSRARGIASAIAGAVMVILGAYTTYHVWS